MKTHNFFYVTDQNGKALIFKIFYDKNAHLHNYIQCIISGSSRVDSTNKESKLELTACEDLVTSIFLQSTATDVDSFGDVIMDVDDTVVVVTVVFDENPHMTLKIPLIPPLKPVTY